MNGIKVSSVIAIVVAWLPFLSAFAHPKAGAHADDMQKVFDGYQDNYLLGFYAKFSSCIDRGPDSIEKRIRRRLAEKYPGQEIKLTEHRYIAHSWYYAGDIPDLKLLESRYPGCKKEIIAIWQKFCKESNSWIKREFGLYSSPWIASAYCAMLYYTHLLGDWDPRDNASVGKEKDTQLLMPPKEIVRELVKACRDIFGRTSHSDYCIRFKDELEKALRSEVTKPEQAVAVMQALWSLKVGTELHNTFAGKGLDESRHKWDPGTEPKEKK